MLDVIWKALENRKFMIALSSVLLIISIAGIWLVGASWWVVLYSILAGVFGGLLLTYVFPNE